MAPGCPESPHPPHRECEITPSENARATGIVFCAATWPRSVECRRARGRRSCWPPLEPVRAWPATPGRAVRGSTTAVLRARLRRVIVLAWPGALTTAPRAPGRFRALVPQFTSTLTPARTSARRGTASPASSRARRQPHLLPTGFAARPDASRFLRDVRVRLLQILAQLIKHGLVESVNRVEATPSLPARPVRPIL